MEIIDYFESKEQSYWLEEIGKSDWVAGHYLHDLLKKNEFKSLCGEGSKVYLLVEGKELMCFCTYAEQDVYVFGIDEPIKTYTGKVIAVYHRINDCEDKWIVSVNGAKPSREEILKTIEFQEQYFCGELYY